MKRKLIRIFFLIVSFLLFGSVKANAETTAFEGIGHYAFATAGNNNAYRGSTYNAKNFSWIDENTKENQMPSNWSLIKENLKKEGVTKITNLTGSKLEIKGSLKLAFLSTEASLGDINNLDLGYKGRILLIRPDGSYKIFNYNGSKWLDTIDITDYLNSKQLSGWYYVSYLDATLIPQTAWVITAIYESDDIPIKYLKLINVNKSIENKEPVEVKFDSKLSLLNKYQLVGIVTGAGISGFQNTTENPICLEREGLENPKCPSGSMQVKHTTMDEAYALLSDGSTQQLYEKDGHFLGRAKEDFANNIYATERSHSILGGELDVFDETLSSSYFSGKEIVGYKFIKTGSNVINVSLVGLSQEIESPDIAIDTSIEVTDKNHAKGVVTLKNVGSYYGCDTKLIIPFAEQFVSVSNVKLSNDVAKYEIKNRQIIITYTDLIAPNSKLVVTFDAKLKEALKNNESIVLNANAITFPSKEKTCLKEITSNDALAVKVSSKTSTVYTEKQKVVENPKTGDIDILIMAILGIGMLYLVYRNGKKLFGK